MWQTTPGSEFVFEDNKQCSFQGKDAYEICNLYSLNAVASVFFDYGILSTARMKWDVNDPEDPQEVLRVFVLM